MDSNSASGGQGFLVAIDGVLARNTAATITGTDAFVVMVERTRLVDLDNDAP